jgi:PGF-pre-PGF domain-containing protein
MLTPLRNRKAFTSLLITAFIVSLLLIPSPAVTFQLQTPHFDYGYGTATTYSPSPPPPPPSPQPPTVSDVNTGSPTEVASNFIETSTPSQIASTLAEATPSRSADVLVAITTTAPDTAGSVVGEMIVTDVGTAIAVIDAMPTDARRAVLSETDPEYVVGIPFATLSTWLADIPADSYAPLTPPEVAYTGSLLSSTATSETYMGDASEGAFSSFFSSPIPITGLSVKFTKSLTNVTVTAEQLSAKPTGIGAELPSGQIVNTYLNITFPNVSTGDIALGQVNFKVERSWISANNIQPYALTLYRYDASLGEWVSLPTNRYDQDTTYNYYAAITPGFSTFAVAGSSAIPTVKYKVSNLTVTPSVPPGGEVKASVVVANISNETITYVGTLWVDNAIEAAKEVRLTANETLALTFTVVNEVAGTHTVRVDTLIRSFTILPSQVTAIETLDIKEAPKTVFAPGETLLPSTTVKNVASANATYVVAVQVFAPDLTTLPSQYIEVTLVPGQQFAFAPSVVLPSDASEGVWSYEVSVFSTFPAQGGVAKAEPVTQTFTVE